MIKTYYVYMHRLGDTGAPFYIGKGYRVDYGKYLRATDYCRRKKLWKSVAKLHGVTSEICAEFFTEQDALGFEAELILVYGRRDNGTGVLVNHTDGGVGCSGYKMAPHVIEALRVRNSQRVITETTRKKISEAASGERHPKYGKKDSDVTKARKRAAMLGKQKGSNSPLAKKILDEATGEIFGSTRDAAAKQGIAMSTLAHKLNGIRPNNTSLRYL